MADDAPIGEVRPTLRNTFRVTLAIWWKLFAIYAVIGFALGFLGYVIPYGQLRFWLANAIVNLLGPSAEGILSALPFSVIAAAADCLVVILGALLLLCILSWLVAHHIGRRFGSYRLVLRRA